MTIPTALRRSGKEFVFTFSYGDIISGTGFVTFLGLKAGSGGVYRLDPSNKISSQPTQTQGTHSGASLQEVHDIDFDITFNRTVTLKGETIINVPIFFSETNTNASRDIYCIAKVRHVDSGATETDIFTGGQSSTNDHTHNTYLMYACVPDITQKTFKQGETLRLSISVFVQGGAAGDTGACNISHNPINIAAGWDTTGAVPSHLLFQVPTRIVE